MTNKVTPDSGINATPSVADEAQSATITFTDDELRALGSPEAAVPAPAVVQPGAEPSLPGDDAPAVATTEQIDTTPDHLGQPRQNKVRARDRIQQLNGALNEQAELTRQWRERAEKAEADKAAAETNAFSHYEQATDSRLSAKKRELADAIATGADPTKLADLYADVGALAAEARTAQALKTTTAPKPNGTNGTHAGTQPQTQPNAQPKLHPAVADWVGRTGWFNPEAADFDPDMHMTAVSVARALEREGRHPVGSPAYFQAIEARTVAAHPRQREDAPAAPQQQQRSPVAPAQRGPAQPGTPNQVTLTPEERALARQSGISEKQYAMGKMKMQRNDSARTVPWGSRALG